MATSAATEEAVELMPSPTSSDPVSRAGISDERPLMTSSDLSKFKEIFDPYEAENGIPLSLLLDQVLTLCDRHGEELSMYRRERIIARADKDRNGRLNYNEFVQLITERPDLRMVTLTRFQKAVCVAVSSVAPQNATTRRGKDRQKENLVESYTKHYNCCPPPLFIVIISVIELIIFITYIVIRKNQDDEIPAASFAEAPRDSPLIYQPTRRYEAWRFITYMFIHSGYEHMIGNLVFQLLLGIPLELVHKFWRVGLVYCLGVIAGSLATSMTDSWTLLCGASGGVYALIGAHFAKIIMNWKDMTHEWLSGPIKFLLSAPVQLAFFTIFMSADTGYAIYKRFFSAEESRIAFVAHFAGFIGGMLVGIRVLKNFSVFPWETKLGWVALATFIVIVLIAIGFNAFHTAHYPDTDWRQCCPLPCWTYPKCH